jgi:hypothetical protein
MYRTEDQKRTWVAMNIDRRWVMLLAIVAGGAASIVAASSRRRNHRIAQDQHATNLKAWENEGGNSVPPSASVAP